MHCHGMDWNEIAQCGIKFNAFVIYRLSEMTTTQRNGYKFP